MGAILGMQMLLLGLYVGVIVGGIVGIAVYAARAFGVRQRVIAYGPYLSFGGLVALYYGRTIVDWLTSQV
jgi:leader peptidase (prepilin peptidase)/N-methyltransferase